MSLGLIDAEPESPGPEASTVEGGVDGTTTDGPPTPAVPPPAIVYDGGVVYGVALNRAGELGWVEEAPDGSFVPVRGVLTASTVSPVERLPEASGVAIAPATQGNGFFVLGGTIRSCRFAASDTAADICGVATSPTSRFTASGVSVEVASTTRSTLCTLVLGDHGYAAWNGGALFLSIPSVGVLRIPETPSNAPCADIGTVVIPGAVRGVAVHPSGYPICAGLTGGGIRCRRTEGGTSSELTIEAGSVEGLAFGPEQAPTLYFASPPGIWRAELPP